jgi:hypothetical protein
LDPNLFQVELNRRQFLGQLQFDRDIAALDRLQKVRAVVQLSNARTYDPGQEFPLFDALHDGGTGFLVGCFSHPGNFIPHVGSGRISRSMFAGAFHRVPRVRGSVAEHERRERHGTAVVRDEFARDDVGEEIEVAHTRN